MLNPAMVMIVSNLPIILGFTLLWLVAWTILRKDKELLSLAHIPGPDPVPILGNSLLFKGPQEKVWLPTFKKLRSQYGPVFKLRFSNYNVIITSTPEDTEKILNCSHAKSFIYDFFQPWLGQGLLTLTGAQWKHHRKLITPTFHFKILKDFLHVMNEQAEIFCQKMAVHAGGGPVDIYVPLTHMSLSIILETAMGINAQSAKISPFTNAVSEIVGCVYHRMNSPWLWNDYFHNLSSCGRRLAKYLKITNAFSQNVIKDRKFKLKEKIEKPMKEDDIGIKERLSFLDLLLTGEKGLSDKEIMNEVDSFLFAGHDTTSSSMSLTLYLLALHPHIQEKCHSEVDEIFGDSSRAATSADLNEMKYLHCCIKETLRFISIVPSIGRVTDKEVELGGFIIPPNTNVAVNIALLHQDPKSFPEPDKFIPERFADENEHCRHPYSYIPFSAGPRNCIGQKFAIMEEKAVLSRVLRSFKLSADVPIEDVPLLPEIVLKPKDGLNVKFTLRDNKYAEHTISDVFPN